MGDKEGDKDLNSILLFFYYAGLQHQHPATERRYIIKLIYSTKYFVFIHISETVKIRKNYKGSVWFFH